MELERVVALTAFVLSSLCAPPTSWLINVTSLFVFLPVRFNMAFRKTIVSDLFNLD